MSIGISKELLVLLAEHREIKTNTTSVEKALWLQFVLDHLLGKGTATVALIHQLAEQFKESDLPIAPVVATMKAGFFGRHLGGITGGADTVFWFWNGRQWESWSKLERLGRPLLVSEIVNQYHYLVDMLCNPQDGVGRVAWDISLAISHQKHGVEVVSERIYVEFYPIDKNIFKIFWQEALKKGYLYKFNSRIEMIELLIASGSIKSVAVTSLNGSVKKMLRKPEKFLLELMKQDIIGTMPMALIMGFADHIKHYYGFKTSS